jgi:CRP/FNR family cyclic AMP-dependent transcriptional regulator
MSAELAPDPVLRVLRDSPLFYGVENAVFDQIVAKLRPDRWPRRRLVMTPNDTLQRFYVLIRGRVKVVKQNPLSGREITLFLLGPGDGFNVVSLLDSQRHEVSVETLDDVEALSAPLESWWTWMETYPSFHRALHQYVDVRIQQLSELVGDLALYDTMTRLVHLIVRHFDNRGEGRRPHVNLIKDLPHDELARMIGTVRVVVNRLLGELRQEGLVNTEGGELQVCDLEKLLLKAERHVDARTVQPRAVEHSRK